MHIRRINFISLPPSAPSLTCLTSYYIALIIYHKNGTMSLHLAIVICISLLSAHFSPYTNSPSSFHRAFEWDKISQVKRELNFPMHPLDRSRPQWLWHFFHTMRSSFFHFRHTHAENVKKENARTTNYFHRRYCNNIKLMKKIVFCSSYSVHMGNEMRESVYYRQETESYIASWSEISRQSDLIKCFNSSKKIIHTYTNVTRRPLWCGNLE